MRKEDLTSQLRLDENGIYRSQNSEEISYPEDGHESCFSLEDNSFWFQHRNDCITAVIDQFRPRGAIIDVGGGNGYVTRGILDAGYEAVLLEPGPSGALNGKVARELPTVICSSFSDAGFKQSSLSAIGCFDVIEHIEYDREFIEQAHFALEQDGLLYIAVPAHQLLWSQSDVSARHYRRYNKAMIKRLLAGRFEILYFSYFFSVLTIPIFFLRALPFRLRGERNKKTMLSKNTEHGTKAGIGVSFLNWRLKKELGKIQKAKSRRFGASCLFVARKID